MRPRPLKSKPATAPRAPGFEPGQFSFSWAGKEQALALLDTPSRAALVSCPRESVHYDTTSNVLIEGDNLDALRLLSDPYRAQVKVIYLDPPYNTGQDFVYPDHYTHPLRTYLRLTGQLDAEGKLLTQAPETSGRHHSAWLSMMYPRLVLARDLLRDDGVLFVSIDEHELAHLVLLFNEVFGEANQLGILTWVKKRKGSHLSRTIRSMTEFVLAYARNRGSVELFGEAAYADKWQYLLNRPNAVGVRRFPAGAVECTLAEGCYRPGRYGKGELAVVLLDPATVRDGRIVNAFRLEGRFKWTQRKIEEELALGTRLAIKSPGFGPNMLRHNQAEKVKRPPTLLDRACGVGTYEDANDEVRELFGESGLLEYPKPTSLVKYLIRASTFWDRDGIVLDFFAGSGTTAQAVLELNQQDGGDRRFILVQLPEPTGRAEYPTIAEIAKERIRRVLARLGGDLGFQVFRVATDRGEG
jgi:adenine-specific DNA-methyltransferase